MSWSLNVIGRPEDLVRELEIQSTRLTGDSKAEFDQAAPHLKALIEMNVGGRDGAPPILAVNANGHACRTDGVVTYSQASVRIHSVTERVLLPTPTA